MCVHLFDLAKRPPSYTKWFVFPLSFPFKYSIYTELKTINITIIRFFLIHFLVSFACAPHTRFPVIQLLLCSNSLRDVGRVFAVKSIQNSCESPPAESISPTTHSIAVSQAFFNMFQTRKFGARICTCPNSIYSDNSFCSSNDEFLGSPICASSEIVDYREWEEKISKNGI